MTVTEMLHRMDSHEIAEQLAYDMASDPDWRKEASIRGKVEEYWEAKNNGGTFVSGERI